MSIGAIPHNSPTIDMQRAAKSPTAGRWGFSGAAASASEGNALGDKPVAHALKGLIYNRFMVD